MIDKTISNRDLLMLRFGACYGVQLYAVWKDGRQTCGIMEQPLREARSDVLAGKRDAELKLDAVVALDLL